jgi:15-cis-phytoene synthase
MQHSTIPRYPRHHSHPIFFCKAAVLPRASDYEFARRLHKKHGTSYYFATRLFPREMREATFALYAFFRVPDELVDNSTSPEEAQTALDAWCAAWERAYFQGEAEHPVLRVASYTFHRYRIPYEYATSFLEAMRRDLTDTRYETYAELESYMYGSASVVGLMMSYVIGFKDKTALCYAEKLGYAMQLTNFLRDIDEDYQLRGRIYMPLDEMAQFGVTPEQIAQQRFDENFRAFMAYQTARAHQLYEEAETGIAMLTPSGQRAVRAASVLYRAILTKLAAQDNNPFAGRARTSTWEKIRLASRIYKIG